MNVHDEILTTVLELQGRACGLLDETDNPLVVHQVVSILASARRKLKVLREEYESGMFEDAS